MANEDLLKIKESELERMIEQKVKERLDRKEAVSESNISKDTCENISRRDFLKKAGIGSLGLGALLSPVSADFFIKDDSFSVQTTSTGDATGLAEGLFVDQNQNVNIPNGLLNVQGDIVVTSSTKEYDIQKNGVDGDGVINFKT